MYRKALLFSILVAAYVGWCACIPVQTTTEETGNRSGEVVVFPSGSLDELEPNNDFAIAMPAEVSDPTLITGKIESETDYDIYSLGPLADGTHLRATIETMQTGELSCCFFDHEQRLLARTTVMDPQESRTFELVLPEPVNQLYLFAFSPDSGVIHDYAATLSLTRSQESRALRPQVVALNFAGASDITVAGHYYPTIPPFDAASIDSRYSGHTPDIIQQVLEQVQRDYAGLNVQIYLAFDPALGDGPYSTIYFGISNPELLGVADGVDAYNAQSTESAIVYTDTFSLFSNLEPDEQMLAQILANVTSHELGHLLGLRHTDDADDIMDVTATARRLMADQWFKKSKLHSSVCPLGYQDGPAMLGWTVGGELAIPDPAVRRPIILASDPRDFRIPRSWLCSHCPG